MDSAKRSADARRTAPEIESGAMAIAPEASAPTWRREPHRLLFPLGAALALVAVLPFEVGGAGGGSLAAFHAVAQIQGFITCFVTAFLYTVVPRRTHTPAPDAWQMSAALILPPAAVFSAWADEILLAQALWLALVVVVLGFTVARMRAVDEPLRIQPAFVWVPLSLLAGALGAALTAVAPLVARMSGPTAWEIGRGLLVQGFVAGLVLGVGGVLVPQLTRGEPPPSRAGDPRRRRRSLLFHTSAASVFFLSFPLEALVDVRLGWGVRALVASGVLLLAARVHRIPTAHGLHRRLVWLGAWLVPLGFWMGAVAPTFQGAALHVLFVGGFAQLTLALATHVVPSTGGKSERAATSPWTIRAMALFLAGAFGARIVATIDLPRVATWLAIAAAAFSCAIFAWSVMAVPALIPAAPSARCHRGSRQADSEASG
jgi:uncharacterized protein involved in response to NO